MIEVYVETQFLRRGIALYVVRTMNGKRELALNDGQWVALEDGDPVGPSPTLELPDEAGKMLLEALAEHYGGTAPTRSMEKSLEVERGRVERLLTALIDVSSRSSQLASAAVTKSWSTGGRD